jgi:glycosyltransferase involved in cell wall biosynthesis
VKVTYVVTRAHPIGGVQIHVRDLATALRARGIDCSVMTGGDGLFVDLLRAEGVPTRVLRHLVVPIHPLHDTLALREIHSALAAERPDVVAAHSSKAGILARIAGRMLGLPVILTAHGWNFTPGIAAVPAAVYRQIERLTGFITPKIITVSEFDRRLALAAGLVGAERVATVYNGIADVPPALRATPDAAPVRLIMVARYGAQKDHRTLLRALGELTDKAWELDLVGDGPLMADTRTLAQRLGLGERVHFLGQRRDVDELLARAQVSVLATNWEGFPLSILEAMRAGLPVVATDVGGIAESVGDGDNGFLVPRGDVGVLRDRIARLLADPDLRSRMGRRGRERFEREFTLEEFVSRTCEVYRQVVADAARTRAAAPELERAGSG